MLLDFKDSKGLQHSSMFERKTFYEKVEQQSTHPLPWPASWSRSSAWWPTSWTEPGLLATSWRRWEWRGGERSSWWGWVGRGGWVSSKRRGRARTSLARWSSASTSAKWHAASLVPSVKRRIRRSYERRECGGARFRENSMTALKWILVCRPGGGRMR